MAIAYKDAGAGASTESNGAGLSPACPATVDAGDVLVAHVMHEGTSNSPSTPDGWTLIDGPRNLGTTPVSRHWVFGKIADGTEDGAAVAFGTVGGTNQRGARVYSFSGRVSGTISDLAIYNANTEHATDPQMPSVTTTVSGGLAVALVAQNDNNSVGSATGESGGDWTEAVAEYTANLTPGLMLQLQTATPTADPGTISGGAASTTNDPCGVIGLEIRPSAPTPTATAVARVSLEAGNTPDTQIDHSLFIRARKTAGGATTIRAALYEGANNRSGDLESTALTTSLADYELAIDDADAEDITSYSNLEVRFWGYSSGGSTSDVEVAEVWLEVPEGTGGATVERSAAISATSGIASAATFYSTLSRSAVLAASASLTASHQRDLFRSAAIGGTGALSASGTHWTTFERSASVAATGTIASAGISIVSGAASIGAIGVISTTPERDLLRSASLSATGAVSATGEFDHIRTASLSATGGIASAPERDHLRSASLAATADINATGAVEGGPVTHERTASIAATGAVAAAGTFWTTFQRSSSASAAGAINSVGQRDLIRTSALSATSGVASAGEFWSIIERSAALAASGGVAASGTTSGIFQASASVAGASSIQSIGQRELLRSALLAASGAVASTSLHEHHRAVAIAAATQLAADGHAEILRSALIEAVTGIATSSSSGLEAAASISAVSAIAAVGVVPDSTYSQHPGATYGPYTGATYNGGGTSTYHTDPAYSYAGTAFLTSTYGD